jgi:hypothetical protein
LNFGTNITTSLIQFLLSAISCLDSIPQNPVFAYPYGLDNQNEKAPTYLQ